MYTFLLALAIGVQPQDAGRGLAELPAVRSHGPFTFHSDRWISPHDFLYRWARSEGTPSPRDTRPPVERWGKGVVDALVVEDVPDATPDPKAYITTVGATAHFLPRAKGTPDPTAPTEEELCSRLATTTRGPERSLRSLARCDGDPGPGGKASGASGPRSAQRVHEIRRRVALAHVEDHGDDDDDRHDGRDDPDPVLLEERTHG